VNALRTNDYEWFEIVLATFMVLGSSAAVDVASFGVTAVSWARLFAHVAHAF
jgi:hypothetical protein